MRNNIQLFFVCLVFVLPVVAQQVKPTALVVAAEHEGPVIGHGHADVVASGNRSGFETGQFLKMDGVYHLFVNEMFGRPHRDMRIAHWTSSDAVDWERQSTVVASIPGRSPSNPRSEVWLTGVEFNEEEDSWNIFYVAYRAGDSTKGELPQSDYAGRIWRAKSVITGRAGIAGPYADMGIVLEPDGDSQWWEGQQAVAAFNPYRVGDMWYAFYDGHNYIPKGPWPVGLAKAPKLEGPWERLPEGINPVPISPEFNENLQVTELPDGRYLAIFDSFGDQEVAYSISEDGLRWSPETRIKVQTGDNRWAEPGDHAMRTPLGAVLEDDGTFTVVYTAMMKVAGQPFYAVGKCTLAWDRSDVGTFE